MKCSTYLALGVVTAMSLLSCSKDFSNEQQVVKQGETFIFEAAQGDGDQTKTAIANGSSVFWSPQDSIKIFYGELTSGKFIAQAKQPSSRTTFKGSFNLFDGTIEVGMESTLFRAVYPYSDAATVSSGAITLTVPSSQSAVAGSFDPSAFPSMAESNGLGLAFYNVCGGLRFTVSQSGITSLTIKGNTDEVLAGKVAVAMNDEGKPVVCTIVDGFNAVTMSAPSSEAFETGQYYYASLLPCELPSGVTIIMKKGNLIGRRVITGNLAVKRSIFGVLSPVDQGVDFAEDLSTLGAANSYIVSNPGTYQFAAVKGNTSESVGAVAAVDVLWESFGTDTAPAVGDLVSEVSYVDGYITFKASDKKGNAVIAAKDADGTILWSWHIWLTDKPEDQMYNNNAGTMMDRNLGATSVAKGDVHALGLFYQWGRKDPFPGASAIDISSPAATTITWPSAVRSDAVYGTIDYATVNPTTLIMGNNDNEDWYYTGSSSTDDTRWQTSSGPKSLFDPCPYGYRVPDGGSVGIWTNAFGVSTRWTTSSNWDSANMGMDFGITDKALGSGTIWYPATGIIDQYGGYFRAGDYGSCWSCSANGDYGSDLSFSSYSGHIDPSDASRRSDGRSVRCVKE